MISTKKNKLQNKEDFIHSVSNPLSNFDEIIQAFEMDERDQDKSRRYVISGDDKFVMKILKCTQEPLLKFKII